MTSCDFFSELGKLTRHFSPNFFFFVIFAVCLCDSILVLVARRPGDMWLIARNLVMSGLNSQYRQVYNYSSTFYTETK
jgi:hypothetical protein